MTTLLATPSAEGLFTARDRAVLPASSMYGTERARDVAARFVHELGIDSTDAAAVAGGTARGIRSMTSWRRA